ncbi:MAG: hypothetical protein KKD36_02900 [Bacteroidetes bacterium]|nr:hypothetical protein [Bacteroidota bacterium]
MKNKVKEVRIFDNKNNLVSLSKYDLKGNVLFKSMDNFTSAVFLKTSETNEYNDNGKLIKKTSTHSSFKEPTIWIKEYDKNQNLLNIKDEKGNLIFQFFYDDSNFKNKEIMYSENKISQTTIFEKRNNGNEIISLINGDFLKNRKNISFFDENKNEFKTESYNNEKLRFSSNSTYTKNRITKIIYNETNGQNGNNFYYDSKNRLIKRELFDIENGKEINGNYEVYEYLENNLIKKYVENINSLSGLNEYRYEYDYYK